MPISLFPLHAIPVEDAFTRIWTGSCHSVFDYDREILTPNLKMKWPAVIARNSNLRVKGKVKLRKESLFYRDHGICVYCEKPLTISTLTCDHVLPRSRGGKTVWDNVVSSCMSCNGRKGSHAPVGGNQNTSHSNPATTIYLQSVSYSLSLFQINPGYIF
jgi:hypothetical protein